MKKRLLIATIILVVFAFLYLLYSSFSKIEEKRQFSSQIKSLPKPSSFQWIGNKPFLNNHETIILFFHPDCEHCHYEAKSIASQLSQFEKVNIWWISSAEKKAIQSFSREYQLNKVSNHYFAYLPIQSTSKTFGSITVPHIFIYNEDQILLKEFKGETKIEALKKYLN